MSSAAKVCILLGLGLAGIVILSRRRKKKEIKVDFGAFVERFELLPPPQPAPPIARHPLTELTFAVQDVFDVEGHVTGFGNPDWAKSHDPAVRTAVAVSTVVARGATCLGKTVMDEMAYSITGENKHYGTPTNPSVSSLMPGGSSSGSAVAVAAELVDFALGVDTGGGVRIPAAFCGILGFCPSYGAVSTIGVVPMAQSFDTVGWFARDPNVLRLVGQALLQLPSMDCRRPRRILIADDCFQLSVIPKQRVINVVNGSVAKLYGSRALNHINIGKYIASKVPSLKNFQNEGINGGGQYIASRVPSLKVFQDEEDRNGGGGTSTLRALCKALQLLQRYEFKMNHEEWVNMVKPILGSSVSSRVRAALETMDESIEFCLKIRNEMRTVLTDLLKDDGVLVIPTAPGLPIKLKMKERLLEEFHSDAFSLLSIASMSGCPQISIPLGKHEGCPVAVSLIARYAADRLLLDIALDMHSSLQEQVEIASSSHPSTIIDSQIESAEVFKEKGNAAFKEKQWHKAVNFYSEAIHLNGKNATYYSNRAAAYLELGRYQQAELDCSKAISLDKKNVKAYLRRGTAREMLSYYKEADEDFRYALVLEPTNKTASVAVNRLKKLSV